MGTHHPDHRYRPRNPDLDLKTEFFIKSFAHAEQDFFMTAIALLPPIDLYRESYNDVLAGVQALENGFSALRAEVKAWQEGEVDHLDQDRKAMRTQIDNVQEVFRQFKANWSLDELFENGIERDNESYQWDRICDRIIDLKKEFAVIDLVPSEAAPQIRERECNKKTVIIILGCTAALFVGLAIFFILNPPK